MMHNEFKNKQFKDLLKNLLGDYAIALENNGFSEHVLNRQRRKKTLASVPNHCRIKFWLLALASIMGTMFTLSLFWFLSQTVLDET